MILTPVPLTCVRPLVRYAQFPRAMLALNAGRCRTTPTGGRTQTAEIGVESIYFPESDSRVRTQTQTTVHKPTRSQQ